MSYLRPNVLPRHELMMSVYLFRDHYSRDCHDHKNTLLDDSVRRRWFWSRFCRHHLPPYGSYVPYIRIDHSAGPGSFADNFAGEACKDCGKILDERRI